MTWPNDFVPPVRFPHDGDLSEAQFAAAWAAVLWRSFNSGHTRRCVNAYVVYDGRRFEEALRAAKALEPRPRLIRVRRFAEEADVSRRWELQLWRDAKEVEQPVRQSGIDALTLCLALTTRPADEPFVSRKLAYVYADLGCYMCPWRGGSCDARARALLDERGPDPVAKDAPWPLQQVRLALRDLYLFHATRGLASKPGPMTLWLRAPSTTVEDREALVLLPSWHPQIGLTLTIATMTRGPKPQGRWKPTFAALVRDDVEAAEYKKAAEDLDEAVKEFFLRASRRCSFELWREKHFDGHSLVTIAQAYLEQSAAVAPPAPSTRFFLQASSCPSQAESLLRACEAAQKPASAFDGEALLKGLWCALGPRAVQNVVALPDLDAVVDALTGRETEEAARLRALAAESSARRVFVVFPHRGRWRLMRGEPTPGSWLLGCDQDVRKKLASKAPLLRSKLSEAAEAVRRVSPWRSCQAALLASVAPGFLGSGGSADVAPGLLGSGDSADVGRAFLDALSRQGQESPRHAVGFPASQRQEAPEVRADDGKQRQKVPEVRAVDGTQRQEDPEVRADEGTQAILGDAPDPGPPRRPSPAKGSPLRASTSRQGPSPSVDFGDDPVDLEPLGARSPLSSEQTGLSSQPRPAPDRQLRASPSALIRLKEVEDEALFYAEWRRPDARPPDFRLPSRTRDISDFHFRTTWAQLSAESAKDDPPRACLFSAQHSDLARKAAAASPELRVLVVGANVVALHQGTERVQEWRVPSRLAALQRCLQALLGEELSQGAVLARAATACLRMTPLEARAYATLAAASFERGRGWKRAGTEEEQEVGDERAPRGVVEGAAPELREAVACVQQLFRVRGADFDPKLADASFRYDGNKGGVPPRTLLLLATSSTSRRRGRPLCLAAFSKRSDGSYELAEAAVTGRARSPRLWDRLAADFATAFPGASLRKATREAALEKAHGVDGLEELLASVDERFFGAAPPSPRISYRDLVLAIRREDELAKVVADDDPRSRDLETLWAALRARGGRGPYLSPRLVVGILNAKRAARELGQDASLFAVMRDLGPKPRPWRLLLVQRRGNARATGQWLGSAGDHSLLESLGALEHADAAAGPRPSSRFSGQAALLFCLQGAPSESDEALGRALQEELFGRPSGA